MHINIFFELSILIYYYTVQMLISKNNNRLSYFIISNLVLLWNVYVSLVSFSVTFDFLFRSRE